MKRFAVIGLGRFGARLAANLAMAQREVIAIDIDRRIVEDIRDRVTLAVCLDATNPDALIQHGIDQVDVGVVGVGADFQATILTTVVLKQIGVPRIVSRASSPMEATILARIGADQVVSPEDEAADRWAFRLASPIFKSQIEIASGTSVVELAVPNAWVGKNLIELDLRKSSNLHVVGIRPHGDTALQVPSPQQSLISGDVLFVMGHDVDLARLHGTES